MIRHPQNHQISLALHEILETVAFEHWLSVCAQRLARDDLRNRDRLIGNCRPASISCGKSRPYAEAKEYLTVKPDTAR